MTSDELDDWFVTAIFVVCWVVLIASADRQLGLRLPAQDEVVAVPARAGARGDEARPKDCSGWR
jgi:hypothetical protein